MAGDELETLRAQAEDLGVKVDGRWGVERLRAEIAAASPDEPPDDDEPDDEPDSPTNDEAGDEPADDEPDEPEPEPAEPIHRAGGHADYGDGRGWVVEE